MKKSSTILLIVGILILLGVFWFLRKDNSKISNTQNSNNQETNQPINIEVNYDSSKPFDPQTSRVEQGKEVVLAVTSNVADELHFHGYDLHVDLESGKQGQITFTADKTGRFEFELEDHKTTLGVIEVYPK